MPVFKPHRGILIDQIPARGIAGLIFTVGTMAILLIGIPAFRIIFVGCLAMGLVVAAALHFWRNQTRW